jgi:hypothetical protein
MDNTPLKKHLSRYFFKFIIKVILNIPILIIRKANKILKKEGREERGRGLLPRAHSGPWGWPQAG